MFERRFGVFAAGIVCIWIASQVFDIYILAVGMPLFSMPLRAHYKQAALAGGMLASATAR